MNKKIKSINARHILDSRANPTIEVEVTTSDNIKGRAAVPSGASTGALEAHELRDNDPSFNGMGVNKAIENVKTIISDTLVGEDVTDQSNIDNKLIELDGTDNKNNLGANAILAVSMASMRASASQQNKQLFELFPNIYGPPSLPVPFMNILNGGAHADNSVDIQEFMIVPFGFETFDTSLRAGVEIYHVLKKRLKSNKLSTNVGDEGGFAPNFNTSTEILDEIMQSISEAGYEPGGNVSLALDVAASEFFTDDFYRIEGNELNSQEMSDYLINLTSNYPIISIEDGLAEDDWDGWKYLTEKIGDTIQLVGDDLFVTQEKILEKGVADSCANSILVKVNQVGSVSETINTMTLAKDSNYSSIVSHRSGETEDNFISDLVVGTGLGQIKTGAPSRSDRTSKYNRLLYINELKSLFLLLLLMIYKYILVYFFQMQINMIHIRNKLK